MSQKIVRGVMIAVALLGVVSLARVAVVAHAEMAVNPVSDQISSLLKQVQTLQEQVRSMNGQGSAAASMASPATSVAVGVNKQVSLQIGHKPVRVPCVPSPVSFGKKDSGVYMVQTVLKNEGYYPEGYVTGYLGALTKKAIQRFQSANDLTNDGVLNQATIDKLRERIGNRFPECGVVNPKVTIHVSAPSQGDVWNVGGTYTIRWSRLPLVALEPSALASSSASEGAMSGSASTSGTVAQFGTVTISVARPLPACLKSTPACMIAVPNVEPYVIARSVPNTGSYVWTIPSTLPVANIGSQEITVSRDNSDVSGVSDTFTIVSTSPSSVSASFAPDPFIVPASVNPGMSNVELARFKVSASGGDVTLNDLSFAIEGAQALVSNLTVFSSAVQISTAPMPGLLAGGHVPVNMTIPNGSWGSISIRADIPTSTVNTTLRFNLQGATFDGNVVSNGLPAYGPSISVSGSTNPPASTLSITTASLPNGVVGQPYSASVAGSTGSNLYDRDHGYEWSVSGLPAGLTNSAPAGIMGVCEFGCSETPISGTPTNAGTYTVTVTLGSGGQTVSKQFPLVIATSTSTPPATTALTIATLSVPDGSVGQSYSGSIQATGGDGDYSWSVTSGSLPPGLSLSQSVCFAFPCRLPVTIVGTPAVAGTYSFTIQVSDGKHIAAQPFKIVVSKYTMLPLPPTRTSATSSSVSVDSSAGAFSQNLLMASALESMKQTLLRMLEQLGR
jgi:hypothetical protein